MVPTLLMNQNECKVTYRIIRASNLEVRCAAKITFFTVGCCVVVTKKSKKDENPYLLVTRTQ
jgi:hypothetical protein